MTLPLRTLLAFTLAFAASFIVATPPDAYAVGQGSWLATASPHYAHPVTGKIEDASSSAALGQSMCKSALYPKALIEVDSKGAMWATVRLNLMDNINNVSFKVQKDAKNAFNATSASLTQENLTANQSDFRIKIPSAKAIVRISFYVKPMGRDVISYISFKGLKAGSGDFVASIAPPKKSASTSGSSKSASDAPDSTKAVAKGSPAASDTTAPANPSANPPAGTGADQSADAQTLVAQAQGLVGKEAYSSSALPLGKSAADIAATANATDEVDAATLALYIAFSAVILIASCTVGGYYLYVRGVRAGRRMAKRTEQEQEQ